MEAKIDRQRVQDFARKLFGHYTSGILTLLVDVGHKTGLFEAAAKGTGTSQEIADRAGLDERYVREWLAAMATGGVIEYDAGSKSFTLPPEHALCLTGSSSRNLAAGSQNLPMLSKLVGEREGDLLETARMVAQQGRGAIYVASEILEKK